MISDRPIDIAGLVPAEAGQTSGAVVTFAGVVRDHNKRRSVTGMFYECYREMAERELERLVDEVKARYPVREVLVRHRVGEVPVGDTSLLVVVTSTHREAAFDACRAVIDHVKRRLPIWKKEYYADGTAKWL